MTATATAINLTKDFTPGGTKINGAYENDRNGNSADLFKAVIREAYGVKDVIIAHHLVFVREEHRDDGFTYQIVEEVPSADCLLFDHEVARRIWGEEWEAALTRLALTPPEHRDEVFAKMYYNRERSNASTEN